MQFVRPILGGNHERQIIYSNLLSSHSCWSFFKISVPWSVKSDFNIIAHWWTHFIRSILHFLAYLTDLILVVQSFVHTNAHPGGCRYPRMRGWGLLQPDLCLACGCGSCWLSECSEAMKVVPSCSHVVSLGFGRALQPWVLISSGPVPSTFWIEGERRQMERLRAWWGWFLSLPHCGF